MIKITEHITTIGRYLNSRLEGLAPTLILAAVVTI